ncbi:substrate-binding domain-containing protein [Vreelandella titanicae]|uniref:LacI family DNA-binding transcriptional regulator n=1 Tax=Vreelandella titanicae TaxID=664683 RepID=UPI00315A0F03
MSGGSQKTAGRRGASVTVKDVAREAGVGVGTVSRVLNQPSSVSDATRVKVESVIAKLGFNPNPIAQSMRSGNTKTLACVVRDFSVPVLSDFVNAMQAAVDPKGYGLEVASSYHDPEREIQLIQRLERRRTDGIVIATSSETHPELLRAISRLTVPVVLLDRDAPEEFDAVLVDHTYGVRAATLHLLDNCHRRVSIISGQEVVRPARLRLAAFREAHEMRGVPVSEDLVRTGSFDSEFAYSEAMGLLRMPNRPTAIVCGGTAVMVGVMRAIRDMGLRLQQDISLISGADSDLARLYSPGISTVYWQHDFLGAAAGRLLLERLATPDRPTQHIYAPSELVLRGSSGPAPTI